MLYIYIYKLVPNRGSIKTGKETIIYRRFSNLFKGTSRTVVGTFDRVRNKHICKIKYCAVQIKTPIYFVCNLFYYVF